MFKKFFLLPIICGLPIVNAMERRTSSSGEINVEKKVEQGLLLKNNWYVKSIPMTFLYTGETEPKLEYGNAAILEEFGATILLKKIYRDEDSKIHPYHFTNNIIKSSSPEDDLPESRTPSFYLVQSPYRNTPYDLEVLSIYLLGRCRYTQDSIEKLKTFKSALKDNLEEVSTQRKFLSRMDIPVRKGQRVKRVNLAIDDILLDEKGLPYLLGRIEIKYLTGISSDLLKHLLKTEETSIKLVQKLEKTEEINPDVTILEHEVPLSRKKKKDDKKDTTFSSAEKGKNKNSSLSLKLATQLRDSQTQEIANHMQRLTIPEDFITYTFKNGNHGARYESKITLCDPEFKEFIEHVCTLRSIGGPEVKPHQFFSFYQAQQGKNSLKEIVDLTTVADNLSKGPHFPPSTPIVTPPLTPEEDKRKNVLIEALEIDYNPLATKDEETPTAKFL